MTQNTPSARSPNALACARWRAKNLDRERARNRQYNARLRALVLAWYSPTWPPSCACCGVTDDLTVDHRDGRGREHRIELFGHWKHGGKPTYLWLIKSGFPPGYQVLCRRCNTSKARGAACRLHGADELAA